MDINFNAYTDKDLASYVYRAKLEIADRHKKADKIMKNASDKTYADWSNSIRTWLKLDAEIGNLENLMRKCTIELRCRGVKC